MKRLSSVGWVRIVVDVGVIESLDAVGVHDQQ